MSLLDRLHSLRSRHRTPSQFDSASRKLVRKLEERVRFWLSNPLGVLLHPRRFKYPLELSAIQSLLILRYDALGDAVLTTPILRYLKRVAPHIRIGVAGSDRSAVLFANDPDVSETYVLSRIPSFSVIRELLRARRKRWDVVVNLTFHDKTRGAIYAKIIAPGGYSATGISGNRDKYEQLYSTVGMRTSHTPTVRQNMQVLNALFNLPAEAFEELPSLPVYEDVEATYRPEIEAKLRETGKSAYTIIHTDASADYKEWGLDNSLALAEQITREYPQLHVFLTSDPSKEEQVKSRVNAELPISYLETPSVLHLATALRGALAVVSPDTSVIHFAGAVGTPVVGLYFEPNDFPPLGSPSRVLYPPKGEFASSIPADEVLEAVKQLMRDRQS